MNVFLLLSFFANALVSAFIGLGGGTFYLLFLNLFKTDYIVIPFIALLCNIAVSGISAGTRFYYGQREDFCFLLFILLPSIISTYIGAQFVLTERVFRLFLSSFVFFILCFTLIIKQTKTQNNIQTSYLEKNKNIFYTPKMYVLFFISFGIGLLSGLIGIGGGIILGPILYLLGMSYLNIPFITAIYIFINSCVGLISQSMRYLKNSNTLHNEGLFNNLLERLMPYWSLVVICLCSGIIAMQVHKKIKYKNLTKIIVICVIMSLAIYNFVRSVIIYYA